MFKLVVLFGLLTIALAKPSKEIRPENVERVGRDASIIAEKTIESHGHSIIHSAASLPSLSSVAQGNPILPAVSLAISEINQLSEKSEKVGASLEKLESSKEKINVSSQQSPEPEGVKVLPTLIEAVKIPQKVNFSIQAKQLSPEKSNESEQGRQYLEKNESYAQVIIHLPEPGTISYLAPSPLVSALTPVASPVVPKTVADLTEKSEPHLTKQEKSEEGQIQIPFVQLRTALRAVPLTYVAAAPGFLLYP